MSSIFNHLPEPSVDPIFRINEEAKKAGPEALNATVGMLFDEGGKVAVFPSVLKALDYMNHEAPFGMGYPPLTGIPAYRKAVMDLIPHEEGKLAAVATTGGTGGLAVNMRLLRAMAPNMPLILPIPAWVNHKGIAAEAGVDVQEVPYLENGRPSIDAIVERIKLDACAVLLQIRHNPTGLDFSTDQWRDLAREMSRHGSVAFLDTAYQGFGTHPKEDMLGVSAMTEQGVPSLIAWSGAKNHTMYSERAGAAAATVPDAIALKRVQETYMAIIRSLQSATATFGQRLVATVQEHFQADWLQNLQEARDLLGQKRRFLIGALPSRFTAALSGKGLFAQPSLLPVEIQRMREKKVFLTDEGRMNLGGIPLARMSEFAQKMVDSLEE